MIVAFVLLPFAWLTFWIGASVIYRRSAGKDIVPRAPADAIFVQSWCSGRSLRNWRTRVGGARNCLLVYIAGGELVVTPKFPFTLLFLPEIYGLEVRIPLTSISSVEQKRRFLGDSVLISLVGEERPMLELQLSDEGRFLRVLGGDATAGSDGPKTRQLRRGTRFGLMSFRAFAALWGSIALIMSITQLAEDYRFRRDGIEIAGVFDSHTGDGSDQGILTYSVAGHSYHYVSLRGSGLYEIGAKEGIFYLPGNPEQAREVDFLPFDLIWLVAGSLMLGLALFGGRLARWLGQIL